MTKYNDVPFVPCNDCSHFESCQEEAYEQGRADAIEEVIALSRAEIDFESQEEQRRFVEFMEKLKEQSNE